MKCQKCGFDLVNGAIMGAEYPHKWFKKKGDIQGINIKNHEICRLKFRGLYTRYCPVCKMLIIDLKELDK